MADTNLKGYIINFLIASLFLISLVSFGVGIAQNYGFSEKVIKTDKIDFERLESQINQTSQDAEAWGESFRSDNLFVALGSIVLFSIWGIAKLIWTATITFLVIFLDGSSAVLGIPPIVTGVIMAIVILSLIFAVWKLVKTGE